MKLTKNNLYLAIKFISIPFVFMDSYSFFSIPISWIGLSILVVPSISNLKNKAFRIYFFGGVVFLFVFNLENFVLYFNETFDFSSKIYDILRYYNLISFFFVFSFVIKFFNVVNYMKFQMFLKWFIFSYSLIIIYIYFAQIFDLYEPFRNRDNTNLLGESTQSIFWLSQPHRAMGTFREPIFLVAFYYPMVLIYFYNTKEKNYFLAVITGLSLGLTRSDYLKFFVIVFIIFLTISYIKNNYLNIPIYVLFLFIFIFSSIGILECNVNQFSSECSDYPEVVDRINSSEELKITSGSNNDESLLDRDRINVVNFFLENIDNLKPVGIQNVTLKYQEYFVSKISKEMYFTNRTLPKYLLTRYNSQNFRTGYYSLLDNKPNVQNLFVFYTVGFGYIFILFLLLYFINLLYTVEINLNFLFHLYLISFFLMSPIEELNAYSGLLLGITSILLDRKKNEQV